MDTTGDLIIRIKNAVLAGQRQTVVPWSKLAETICRLLVKSGYLSKATTIEGKTKNNSRIKQIMVNIAFSEEGEPLLTDVKRVSKPGRRQTCRMRNLPRVLKGYGMAIISTPEGIMSDKEARKKKLGGEILCLVW